MIVDCRRCTHGQDVKFFGRVCDVLKMPIELVRDERGECGLRGKLFEPIECLVDEGEGQNA